MPKTVQTSHPKRSRVAAKAMAKASTIAEVSTEFDYSDLLASIRCSFDAAIRHGQIFRTDATELNELYLASLPLSHRQHHNCHACRDFLRRFGGLVTTEDERGELTPVMWSPPRTSTFFERTFTELRRAVKRARITGVFYSKDKILGTPVTGSWSHMAVVLPPHVIYRERSQTAAQAMAEKKADYKNVSAALAEFGPATLDAAVRVLSANALHRSKRFIAPVKWLQALQARPKGRAGENILWLAVAIAPPGFCHLRSGIVGALLEDIAAGLIFSEIRSRFEAKLNPLQYQRPQAAPATGNIKAAEALVAKLEIGPSLQRRFATLADMQQFIWQPPSVPVAPTSPGIFGHLKPKNSTAISPLELPTTTMTWEKFARTVLPTATKIQFYVPYSGSFIALTAATHADSPPILKWDNDDARNTVAWYLHHPAGTASNWRLVAHTWVDVTAIVPFPTLWGARPLPEIADGAIILLSGAFDVRKPSRGNAIFPETLTGLWHSARATIEAFSKTATLGGAEEANACGYDLRTDNAKCSLRIDNAVIHIDRWD